MHKFKVAPLLAAQDVLTQMSIMLHSKDLRVYPRFPDVNKADLRRLASDLTPELAADELEMCRKGVSRLLATIDRTADAAEIAADIDDLRRRLFDQMESVFCLLLSGPERCLFEAEAPFGKSVEANFGSASEDIYEAAKCLALGRSTACVMHLMRVCEAALVALATSINVPRQDDWGSYIRKIGEELDKRARTAGKRTPEEQFYSETINAFEHLKRAWRNTTMHVEKTYTPERAREIFEAIKSFMVQLAIRISQKP